MVVDKVVFEPLRDNERGIILNFSVYAAEFASRKG
jgi:hypothetical protein